MKVGIFHTGRVFDDFFEDFLSLEQRKIRENIPVVVEDIENVVDKYPVPCFYVILKRSKIRIGILRILWIKCHYFSVHHHIGIVFQLLE